MKNRDQAVAPTGGDRDQAVASAGGDRDQAVASAGGRSYIYREVSAAATASTSRHTRNRLPPQSFSISV